VARTGIYLVPALTDTSLAPGYLTDISLAPSQGTLATSVCFGSHISAADTLTLLINASATVTVYRGHLPSYLPAINSLFIMCVGIIRNNSLVGGPACAEARTSATERVTLYGTWRPSALTIRPHGQVVLL